MALANAPAAQNPPADTKNGGFNPFSASSAPKQEIYVLRDGFEGWQTLYKVSCYFSLARRGSKRCS